MAFVKIEDEFGETELLLFPSTYQQTLGLWQRDRVVIVRGKVNAKDREGNVTSDIKIMVDDGREVTHEQATAYQATGRKQRELKAGKRKGSALQAAVMAAKSERSGPGATAPGGPGAAVAADASVAATAGSSRPARVYIRLVKSDDHDMLAQLKTAIDEQQGDSEVVLVLGPDAAKQAVKLPTRMSREPAALERLQSLVGASNVVVQ